MGQRTLTRQLEAFRTGLLARLPPDEREAILGAAEDLRAELSDRKSPVPGDTAPAFTLPDQHGQNVSLKDRLRHGPVVILFVRGGWCPFCTLTLRAYQEALPAIQAAGADLLGITPQCAVSSCAVAERDLLAFPMLSDVDNRVADTYGVAYELSPAMRKIYTRLGHDLPKLNKTGNWQVPLPATFIIGTDGRVLCAHVEPVAHRRLEPSEVVRALQELRVNA
ncbi:peroxiredoxin-like family protein [Acidisphaera sp. L21]|uniref:peroxiredoxin-like family protein n=1 Tax=Acidisphaera sp. L21 TaxID=1641851 RepID=UPI00131AB326|nr:peroxiredoxin-like family protein [Acidisphaera sp. L21]